VRQGHDKNLLNPRTQHKALFATSDAYDRIASKVGLSVNSTGPEGEGLGKLPEIRFTGTQMERQTTAFIQSDYA
jgi:hypothetical protein